MTPELRVLHVATRWLQGGSERDIEAAIEVELARGYDVSMAIGVESQLETPPGVAITRVPHLVQPVSPFSDLRGLRELRSLVRAGGYDLVMTHQSKAGVLGRLAAWGAGAMVVHTIHGASFGPGWGRVRSMAFRAAESVAARPTDLFVTVGNELQQLYCGAGIGNADRYVLVRSPIELSPFFAVRQLGEGDRVRLRSEFIPSAQAPLVIVAGALEARKRPQLAIEQLAPMLRRGELELVFAGDGPLRGRLSALASERGVSDRVHLLGRVERMPELMAAASVIVHCAWAEGVPRVVIEAFAAGLPLVATDVIGMREVPAADVTIVDRDGRGLSEKTAAKLASADAPVPEEELAQWTAAAVREQNERLHDRIERELSSV